MNTPFVTLSEANEAASEHDCQNTTNATALLQAGTPSGRCLLEAVGSAVAMIGMPHGL